MNFGIAARLSALLAGITVLAVSVTAYFAYDVSRALLITSAKNELLTATRVLARRIQLSRNEISRNLQVLSAHPAASAALQRGDADDLERVATLFELTMRANPGYYQLRLIDAREHGMERVRVERDGQRLLHVSGDDLQEKGHFAYVYDTLRLGVGQTYLSRIAINHEHGNAADLERPTVQLAMPVVRPSGAVLGIVVVNVDLNGSFSQLTVDLPRDFQLFLANSQGDFLIHPDPARTFGFDKGRRVLIQEQFPETARLVAGQAEQQVLEVRRGDYSERPAVAAFIARRILFSSEESQLIVGLAQPLDDILAQVSELGVISLRILLGLCVACVALAILVARAVTRPINSMSHAVERFAEGHQADGLPLERQDEIGVLARSFYRMRLQIRLQMAELRHRREEMENLARHDPLTGLPNRRLLVEQAEHTFSVARRENQRLALLFIDLDRFKPINDNLGHAVGDLVLKAVAERIRSAIRESDTPARLGGDEFVVLLAKLQDNRDAQTVAEKIRAVIAEPLQVDGHCVDVSACIGIALFPEDGTDVFELARRADVAMYRAKENGRNAVAFYDLSI